MVKMRRGESRSLNNWLRVRVLAQGLTICAVVVGTWSLGHRAAGGAPAEADLERRREEKAGRDRKAFEERLRVAEEAHGAEEGRGAGPAPATAPERRGAREKLEEKLRAGTNVNVPVGPASQGGGAKSGRWMGWFGGKGGSA
jgi:hypothetical protein